MSNKGQLYIIKYFFVTSFLVAFFYLLWLSAAFAQAPVPLMRLLAPVNKGIIFGDKVVISYERPHDNETFGIDHAQFQLDSGPVSHDVDFNGIFELTGVEAGMHTLRGYFADKAHKEIIGTTITILFETTTASSTLVSISDLAVKTEASMAEVMFRTSRPATSLIALGTTTAFGSVIPIDSLGTTTHRIVITPLRAGTLYYYGITISDFSNNQSIDYPTASFTTKDTKESNAGATGVDDERGKRIAALQESIHQLKIQLLQLQIRLLQEQLGGIRTS